MSKSVVSMGYKTYVVDVKDALAVLEILDRAERMETKWDKDTGKSYFVYEQTPEDRVSSLELIPDDLYRMAKLAGRPTK